MSKCRFQINLFVIIVIIVYYILNSFNLIRKCEGRLSPSIFDGQLRDITVTCLCAIHLMNDILLERSWLYVGHEGCCCTQIRKRWGSVYLPNRKHVADVSPNFRVSDCKVGLLGMVCMQCI